jgi:dihydroneopterin aldolase
VTEMTGPTDDRIVLSNMRFNGRHGLYDEERAVVQPFEVDVELAVDLRSAGESDDLEQSVDYGPVYATVRRIVETESFRLLEAIAEAIGQALLADRRVTEVIVRVRKPNVRLGGPLDHAGVEITRRRSAGDAPS